MKQLLVAALMLLGLAAMAQPQIEVVDGTRPTTRDYARIVCKTEPGSTATVNGQPAHVYKTGCFGAQVALAQGDNTITVTTTKDGRTATKDVTVTRNERGETKPAAEPVMRDVKFTVETQPGAYLQYGNGTDRLGGSKMGFIDEGWRYIQLRIGYWKSEIYNIQTKEQITRNALERWRKSSYDAIHKQR